MPEITMMKPRNLCAKLKENEEIEEGDKKEFGFLFYFLVYYYITLVIIFIDRSLLTLILVSLFFG